ncbi:hypothetical protein [Leptospira weilii]|uniref:hypothetical protein n=1 Tax=Leptospira weilii TaxID=28184 RepID=UPI00138F9147|nr:hypothetical protein [Leptospira weilii]
MESLGRNTDIDIKTLEPLRSIKLLKNLGLFVPNINNISPLIDLKQLKDLRIQSTSILDFSPIGKLVQLEKLTIMDFPRKNGLGYAEFLIRNSTGLR